MALPSRVAARSPFAFLFEVPPMSAPLMQSAERDGKRAGLMKSDERGGGSFRTDVFLKDIARQ